MTYDDDLVDASNVPTRIQQLLEETVADLHYCIHQHFDEDEHGENAWKDSTDYMDSIWIVNAKVTEDDEGNYRVYINHEVHEWRKDGTCRVFTPTYEDLLKISD